jgi:itaconyl-CoA hydratase
MSTEAIPASWRGRFYEDLEIGDVYRSAIGRTISEVDNTWFTTLTMNTNQNHFNAEFAGGTRFGRLLVNSCLTLSVVTGLSVRDTSENAAANLAWEDVRMPHPVYVGDTLWAESEILTKRTSQTRPSIGIVSLRTRGINQRGETVIEFGRSYMLYRRHAPEVRDWFPEPNGPWGA